MIIGRRFAATLSGAFAVLLLGAFASPVAAQPSQAQDPPQVQLVLDVSGSMEERDIDGGTRMDAAKQAFNELIDALPETVHLGIRTLGANYAGEDPAEGCLDSEQLYPVGRVNKEEAKAAVGTLKATGYTPISHALREAVGDFNESDNTRRIVLITDGEDTCGDPGPCEVARQLAAEGVKMTIDTLGLTPKDEKVRTQLSCIAEATGGTYTAVQDTEQLRDRLVQIVERTDKVQVDNPTDVAGAADGCTDAPILQAGVYSDREEFGEHRFYRVQLAPGREIRVSASVAADRTMERDYGVLVRLLDDTGRELVRGSEAGHGRTDVISAGLRYPWTERTTDADATDADSTESPDPTESADAETLVCVEVSNAFAAAEGVELTPGMPLELTIDLVAAPDSPSDVAAYGLARGWVPLLLLTVTGLFAGLLWGGIRRIVT
jgi:Ca-activated chloride channel family protein